MFSDSSRISTEGNLQLDNLVFKIWLGHLQIVALDFIPSLYDGCHLASESHALEIHVH